MTEPVDLLVAGASELATPCGSAARGGSALGELHVVPGGAVAVRGERIVAVGPEDQLRAAYAPARVLDASGGTLVPGFVDAHTHPVFAGSRADEFEQRTTGASYAELAAAGGGILSTVRAVRAASREELVLGLMARLDAFLDHGTTTVEAKSGYGLSLPDELRCLEAIDIAGREHALDVVATFLGAHEVPPEHRDRRDAYTRVVRDEMLPQVAEAGLAEYCDAFVEEGVFDAAEARPILERARELGLGLRLHVDQLSARGGAQLAAELGAASADHLEFVSDAGIEALAASGVVPVLCPLVPLFLRVEQEAPARRMIAAGLAPALATDFNPGSCTCLSLPEAISWAALRLRLSAAECLTAATLNAAASLGRAESVGSLEPEKLADVVVLDLPDHRHLAYEMGRNPVRAVVKRGTVVRERAGAGLAWTPRGAR